MMFGSIKPNARTNSEWEASCARLVQLRRDAPSRFKHLKYMLDATPSDKRQLFVDYAFEIFHLFTELVCCGEANPPNPNVSSSSRDLDFALWILEHMLIYLPDRVSDGWQLDSMLDTILRCVHPMNHIQTRKIGLRCFFMWYQCILVGDAALSPAQSTQLDTVFSVLVPYFPVPSSSDPNITTSSEKVLLDICSQAGSPFVPSSAEKLASLGSSQIRQSFLERLLYGVVKETERLNWPVNRRAMHVKCLQLLLDRVVRHYMTLYFPRPLPTLDVYNYKCCLPEPPSFTSPYSPLSVNDPVVMCRAAVVHWIAGYAISYNPQTPGSTLTSRETPQQLPPNYELMRHVLFSTKENVNLVLSILKEGLMLPLQCSKVMSRVFRIIREWLLGYDTPPFMSEVTESNDETCAGLEASMITLVEVLLSFYFSPYLPIEREKLSTAQEVNQRIQALLRYLINESRLSQPPFTRRFWGVMLRGMRLVIERTMPPTPPSLGVDLPQQYSSMVATSLLYTLLLGWVMATGLNRLALPDSMWDSLVETLQARTAWEDVVEQWAQVMAGITRALGLHCFAIDLQDQPLARLSGHTRVKDSRGMSKSNLDERNSDKTELSETPSIGNQHQFDFIGASPVATSPLDTRSVTSHVTANSQDVSPALLPKQKLSNSTLNNLKTSICDSAHGGDTVSLEGSASIDSASLALSCDGGTRTSVMFGVDQDCMTPSPSQSVTGDDQDPTSFHDFADMTRLDEGESGLLYSESWMLVWRRMLGVMGDLDLIKDSAIHSKAVGVFVDVTKLLIQIRENQGVSVDGLPCDPPNVIPPLDCLVGYLLKGAKRTTCQLVAIEALCKVYLRRPLDLSLNGDECACLLHLVHSVLTTASACDRARLLAQMVPQVLYMGSDRHPVNHDPSLLRTTCNLLLPSCLQVSKSLLCESSIDRMVAAQFMASLAVLSACQSPKYKYMLVDGSEMSAADILFTCEQSLIGAYNSSDSSSECKGVCVRALCCVLYVVHRQGQTGSDLSEEVCATLVHVIRDATKDMALVAVQGISPLIGVVESRTAGRILEVIVFRLVHSPTGEIGALQTRLVGELLLWCVAYPPEDILPVVRALCKDTHPLALTTLIKCYGQLPPSPFSLAQLSSSSCNASFVAASGSTTLWSVAHNPDANHTSLVSTNIGGRTQWLISPVDDSAMQSDDDVDAKARQWLLSDINIEEGSDVTAKQEHHVVDPLETMCMHLAATSKECLPDPNFPHVIPDTEWPEEEQITQCINELSGIQFSSASAAPVLENSRSGVLAEDCWPQLAASLGLLGIHDVKQVHAAHFDEKDAQRLEREMSHLSKQRPRETHKVAVIYVAQGQEDKESILSNTCASAAFEHLVQGLGWEVNLATHVGYSGGLSAKEESCTAPYYANAMYEVIYHVSTRLPLGSEGDVRPRLKHVGNDEVLIVWSEHYRDYRKSIIPTQFADVLIVLYPLQDGLCRVSITCSSSDTTGAVGPLFDGAIIPCTHLPVLLRTTVINCGRAKRAGMSGWTESHHQRANTINHFIHEFAPPTPFAHTLRTLFTPSHQNGDHGEVVMV